MIKNLPLLLAMLMVGSSVLTMTLSTQFPNLLHWVLITIAIVLNVWSLIGLILHIGIQKYSEN